MESWKKAQWVGPGFRAENLVPGIVIGFLLGMLFDLAKPQPRKSSSPKLQSQSLVLKSGDQELKMVLVVRVDLKMKAGKIASQCAHAATGMYAQLINSRGSLLRQWEQCGQPKVVVTCKNQPEMIKLKDDAESIGLPTFLVADAGRTQVSQGSTTVLAIGPGPKAIVDSVTGKQCLL